jgi:hypothetical protein
MKCKVFYRAKRLWPSEKKRRMTALIRKAIRGHGTGAGTTFES